MEILFSHCVPSSFSPLSHRRKAKCAITLNDNKDDTKHGVAFIGLNFRDTRTARITRENSCYGCRRIGDGITDSSILSLLARIPRFRERAVLHVLNRTDEVPSLRSAQNSNPLDSCVILREACTRR